MKSIYKYILLVMVILTSCKVDEIQFEGDAVSVGGLQVSFNKIGEVNFNDATVYANIVNQQNREIQECGVYYSTVPNFSIGQAKCAVSESNDGVSYSVKITGLTDAVRYYFRFYVNHSGGVSLSAVSSDMTFETPINYRVPDVALLTNDVITETKTEAGRYERYIDAVVLHNGHYDLTEYGIYYSANQDMSGEVKIPCSDQNIEPIDGKVYFTVKLPDYEDNIIQRDQVYYYQAYAKNAEMGEGKSTVEAIKIERAREYPSFEITNIKILGKTDATMTVKVVSQGIDDMTEYGYYLNGRKTTLGNTIANGEEFTVDFTDLTMGTNNEVYIYGVNSDGETPAPDEPRIFYTGLLDKYDESIVYVELDGVVSGDKKYYFLDRNLGARESYPTGSMLEKQEDAGWLFQWGREADGHQIWNPVLKELDAPLTDYNLTEDYKGKFLKANFASYDWLSVSKEVYQSLWNDSEDGGINNPCPEGYRVPTSKEMAVFYGNKAKMKLVDPGTFRAASDGTIRTNGAYFWVSDLPEDKDAGVFNRVILSTGTIEANTSGAGGHYIRCVRVE